MRAGLAAHRESRTRVLLLEAGPPDDADEIHLPAGMNMLFQSQYDWNFHTVPQERAAGRSIYWPRGRTLGGSSSLNAMIYMRGNRLDYDTWRDDYGCAGWGYPDIVPYFLRAEDNSRGQSAYHGAGGPLSVQDLKHKSPLTRAFVAATRECGLPANEDFNGVTQDGTGFYQVTQRDGRRWSAADAYLRPALGGPTSPCTPTRWPPACWSRRAARPACATCAAAPRRWPGPTRRSSCRPAPSAARTCCCCPASARPSS